tara:strand:- start:3782 stop:5620 length:1839 start_codon:yes stop_codon:yes gene_type:complete
MNFKIHVGPPKTGTSAIQKWCLDNKTLLLGYGIYYPEHDVDPNGVSSGNLLSLFERTEDGELVYSKKKYKKLLKDAKALGVDTILLSSEFFFKKIAVIAEAIPEAVFVAYIRFELSLIESGYNQSVKRHGKTELLKISQRLRSQSLSLINSFIYEYGSQRFVLRSYNDKTFSGGNIVSDLLEAVGVAVDECKSLPVPRRINTGYSLEGLEFKRWFNKFEAGYLQEPLDRFLQHEARNADLTYSILSGSEFCRSKKLLLKELKLFCNKNSVHNGDLLFKDSELFEQGNVKLQHIGLVTFIRLVRDFLQFEQDAHNLLSRFISEFKGEANSAEDSARFSELSKLITISDTVPVKPFNVFPKLGSMFDTAKSKLSEKFDDKNIFSSFYRASNAKVIQAQEANKNVLALYHDIPLTGGDCFIQMLEQSFLKGAVYRATSLGGAPLLSKGQGIILPKNTRVMHGHFKATNSLECFYPNAIQMCWVRDPLERLWLHFQYIIHNEKPSRLYDMLMKLAQTNKLVDPKFLFVAMMEDDGFDRLKNIYSYYLSECDLEKFGFVGSVHNYANEIVRLSKMLPKPLVFSKELKIYENLPAFPKDLRKYDYHLSAEYELVERFL